jgi:hypothetical protein
VVNAPWLFEVLFNLARPFLSEKQQRNMTVHSKKDGWSKLHAEVSPSILPAEFGGTSQLAPNVDNTACVNAILGLTDVYYKNMQQSRMAEPDHTKTKTK